MFGVHLTLEYFLVFVVEMVIQLGVGIIILVGFLISTSCLVVLNKNKKKSKGRKFEWNEIENLINLQIKIIYKRDKRAFFSSLFTKRWSSAPPQAPKNTKKNSLDNNSLFKNSQTRVLGSLGEHIAVVVVVVVLEVVLVVVFVVPTTPLRKTPCAKASWPTSKQQNFRKFFLPLGEEGKLGEGQKVSWGATRWGEGEVREYRLGGEVGFVVVVVVDVVEGKI